MNLSETIVSHTEEVEKSINITFKDKELLTQALMHRSFVVEHNLGDGASNERLEFLGDAVLELVVTWHLYKAFPQQPEGVLTQWRSVIVNTKHLAESIKKLNFTDHILLSRGEKLSGGFDKDRILANIIEGIIGAIYIDQGYDKAKEFIDAVVLQNMDELLKDYADYNPKGILQERIQANKKVTPEYKILDESGPDHAKTFVAGIFLEGTMIGKGEGASKKEAEEEGARDALEKSAKNNSFLKTEN